MILLSMAGVDIPALRRCRLAVSLEQYFNNNRVSA